MGYGLGLELCSGPFCAERGGGISACARAIDSPSRPSKAPTPPASPPARTKRACRSTLASRMWHHAVTALEPEAEGGDAGGSSLPPGAPDAIDRSSSSSTTSAEGAPQDGLAAPLDHGRLTEVTRKAIQI